MITNTLLHISYLHAATDPRDSFLRARIWPLFMAQLTLARFRGDTAFGLFSRLVSTLIGAAVGTVLWYISCGKGNGNPWGLAVVTAVAFPPIFLVRLYYPGPPITPIIACVTIALVLGYSWKGEPDRILCDLQWARTCSLTLALSIPTSHGSWLRCHGTYLVQPRFWMGGLLAPIRWRCDRSGGCIRGCAFTTFKDTSTASAYLARDYDCGDRLDLLPSGCVCGSQHEC